MNQSSLPTPPYDATDAGSHNFRMPKDPSQRSTPNTIRNSPVDTVPEPNIVDGSSTAAGKPRRVRTGCLTCRERHLKCDEGVPVCQNCRKSSRQCKRGVRLNFIDTRCEQPPHLLPPVHDWKVTFEDNSREIASEYEGGLQRYSPVETPRKRRRLTPPTETMYDYSQLDAPIIQQQPLPQQGYQPFAEPAAMYTPTTGQSFDDPNQVMPQSYPDHRQNYDQQMMIHQEPDPPAPPLTLKEEVLYMQVFVEEVALWMDSMDKDKHFSRILPFQALREPMLKYALLACGVRHLTLINSAYPEEHALTYYAESNKLLLKSLQNPNRDTVLCATAATILNVYETMSEKALQRMNHIAGARALIKECRWDASSNGVGGACFWLNVGMELFSCLHFNWGLAWDPDTWGIDMTMNPQSQSGNEVEWTHKMLWILAKITNFRSSTPRFQEQTMHAEQIRLQTRLQQWLGLKQFCDRWDKCAPPSMQPMAVVPPYLTSSKSAFPEVWHLKRTAIVGRLFWHTAQVLLASTHPLVPWSSQGDTNNSNSNNNPQLAADLAQTRLHHARQICGIVKHAKDRGVASASIRCLAVAGDHLRIRREQEEVLEIFERIKGETGWRVAFINDELKEKWGWNKVDAYGNQTSRSAFYQQSSNAPSVATVPASQPTRQKPPSGIVNPLYKNADFASQNPPYQGSYVPPVPAASYLSHHHGVPGNEAALYRYGTIAAL
ncbi:hypothetical protein LTR05_005067 [Lithohypha guttulata]|uniref:Zn(2)-C6 fungal-type domain-containing protein n=1 Tax=Lithohypha guttulata TaxID=1690604 RepID=A0AAN7T1H9_9EURO|nr:hypothetical protein LTR05_005067 [Lithohypha guttulata]